jgi:hypothetical protein
MFLQVTTSKIRGLLNKITPERYDELVGGGAKAEGEWFTLYNDKYAQEIVQILFDMAVEQPTFCSVYRYAEILFKSFNFKYIAPIFL